MFAPRFYTFQQPSSPQSLFSLFEDLERIPQQGACSTRGSRQGRRHLPTFTPKFDLKETETHFELHGELPGIAKDNVHIEFSDPQTLVVRGSIERNYTAGTPPAGLISESEKQGEAIEAGEEPVVIDHDSEDASSTKSYHATVEDEAEEGTEATATAQPTPATTNAELEKPAEQSKAPEAPRHKYWVSERSYGHFARSFSFPSRVETEGVTASLTDGILTVAVPKAKKHESYRISVF